jgi:hypothetical protein
VVPGRERERKRNRIKKGDGPDALADPAGRDGYPFVEGYFYQRLEHMIVKSPSKSVFAFCKEVVKRRPPKLSRTNRWVYRRMANAYAWLDQNRSVISETIIEDCLEELRGQWGFMVA